MDYFQDLTTVEEKLRAYADINKIPIAGTFELTPLCNMDCRMCYVKMSKEEMNKKGYLRTADEWISIGRKCVEEGLMFLLLTGGEPFLYPDFIKVYNALRNMGIVIMINSNGTMLSKDILSCLSHNKPRRVNLSLYGASDKSYERLCRNPKGFTQVISAVEALKENNIDVRFNMAITPWNFEDFEEMLKISDKYNVPVSIANYLFPAERRGLNCIDADKQRFSPEMAAKYDARIMRFYKSHQELYKKALEGIQAVEGHQSPDKKMKSGFWCRGGNSSFWLTWDFRLLPCGMVNTPYSLVTPDNFKDSWMELSKKLSGIYLSEDCYNCSKRSICQTCAASMITETGFYDKKPEYQCKLTEATLKEYEKIVGKN